MKRYTQLDSLRGIAAVSVLLYHYLVVLDVFWTSAKNISANWIINLLKYTPVHILWGGYEAVLFFFVLSGFVLSLRFYTNKRVKYWSFLLSRFFRIYIPCYVAILTAIILDIMLSKHGISGLSWWFNSIWVYPVTLNTFVTHALLIFPFGYGQINPVLWTLVIEIRISLLFPIIITLIKYSNWKIGLIIGVLLNITYYTVASFKSNILFIPTDYIYTLAFILMFLVGALIAKNRTVLESKIADFSKLKKSFCF